TKIGAAADCPSQIRGNQERAPELSAGQQSSLEIGAAQVCAPKVCAFQVRPGQIGASEVTTGEKPPAQVGASQAGAGTNAPRAMRPGVRPRGPAGGLVVEGSREVGLLQGCPGQIGVVEV